MIVMSWLSENYKWLFDGVAGAAVIAFIGYVVHRLLGSQDRQQGAAALTAQGAKVTNSPVASGQLIFGDESADETRQRTFAISGLIASPEIWETFRRAWLKRTGGKIFHAADCESDHGDFAVTPENSHADNLKLYADLVQLLAHSGVRGYAAALDIGAWYEAFAGAPKDMGYYKCLQEVIKHFAAEYRGGTELEFTFDRRQESEYNAGLLYQYMVTLPEWKEQGIFMGARINFDSRKDVRIQVADIIAREAMKHLDNLGKRPMRRSLKALTELPGVPFVFDFFTREYCFHTKAIWPQLEEATGMHPENYLAWLKEKRLASDNWSNRFRYVNWLNLKDIEEEKK